LKSLLVKPTQQNKPNEKKNDKDKSQSAKITYLQSTERLKKQVRLFCERLAKGYQFDADLLPSQPAKEIKRS
jgi:hypothetical protein